MILGHPDERSKTMHEPSDSESSLSIAECLDRTEVEPQPGSLDTTAVNQDETICSTTLIS